MKLEKTKGFWMYIVLGALCAVLGVFLLPTWAGSSAFFSGWGAYSVNITISGLILVYVLFYLVKRIKRYSNTPAQIVSIVELVVMAIIAIVCTASLFVGSVSLGEPCQIFAIIVWVRGVSGVFTGYYCDSNIVRAAEEERRAKKKDELPALETLKKEKPTEIDTEAPPKGRVDDFTVWRLAFSVVLISAGTYLFVDPFIKHVHLQWVFSCVTIAVGLFFMAFGMAKKPAKVKIEKASPEAKKEEGQAKADVTAADKSKAEEKTAQQASAKDEGAKKAESVARAKKEEPVLEAKKEESSLEKKEDVPQLEGAKVNIKVSGESANAMTQTAAYDAIEKE